MMRNEYVIESNCYKSHTIAAERNPFKYIITVFPAGLRNDRSARDHHFYAQKDEAVAKRRRRSAKKTRKEKTNISSLRFSPTNLWKSLLGKRIPGPGPENLAGPANRKIPQQRPAAVRRILPLSPFSLFLFSTSFTYNLSFIL